MVEIDSLVMAFAPVFAAGFATQQLLELIDPGLTLMKFEGTRKKFLMGIISIVVGALIVSTTKMSILTHLGIANVGYWGDLAITALVISAGTEGLNSIMKFLGYAKENKKAAASDNLAGVESDKGAKGADSQLRQINRIPKN